MPLGVINTEFLDLNSVRAYPLADDASRVDTTGSFTLPDSFLVECYLAYPYALALNPNNFYLSALAVFPIGFAVSIGYNDGTSSPPTVATATFASATHTENLAYALTGVGSFADVTGSITVGLLADINLQPAGLWAFDFSGGKLDPDVVRPTLRGLSSLTITSAGITSSPIYGDVTLVAGTNIQLTVSGQSVRIDAVEGAGLTEDCSCTGATTPPPAIRTINGIPPDNTGAFNLVGNACLSVSASGGGIALADTCSQPCCGCPELEALTTELSHVNDEITTMETFLAGLQAQFNAMSANVLGSRLGDAPCLPPCA